MERIFFIVISTIFSVVLLMLLATQIIGYDKKLYGNTGIPGSVSNKSRLNLQSPKNSLVDYGNATISNTSFSEPVFIFDNKSGSGLVTVMSHSFWNHSLESCNSISKCSTTPAGWKNTSSIAISSTDKHETAGAKFEGKPITVKSNEKYQFFIHLKLNQWVKQSHVTIEGFNDTSKKWYEIVKCPYSIDGPLNWQELSCVVTIENSTTKIRPVIVPGWSSQEGKDAVSSFGPIYLINLGNPFVTDPNLKTETVAKGLDQPTSTAFLGPNRILFLEKTKGTVREIVNGTILHEPLLDVNVANFFEMGMLGVSVEKNVSTYYSGPGKERTFVFLYYTASEKIDGGKILGNRLYRYELIDNKLVNPKLLLELPVGVQHNGGKILIGPDNNVYVVIGEVDNKSELYNKNVLNEALNYDGNNSSPIDGRGGILRVDQNGDQGNHGILGDEGILGKYYAYGIRNSFGIAVDPLTGNLWDTENGPEYGDEINLVSPGFNSGWNKVQGIWKPVEAKDPDLDFVAGDIFLYPKDLVDFNGKGKYSPPEFIWKKTVGPTAIRFLNSDRLGKQYRNDLFVGDINNGNLYHFDLDKNRTALLLHAPLDDKVANNSDELDNVIFGGGLNVSGITDLQVGPDGYLYVTSFGRGEIYRIMPNDLKYNILDYLDKLASNKKLYSNNIAFYDTGLGLSTKDCFRYDMSTSTIVISCKSTDFADLYDLLKNTNFLRKQGSSTWILNSNLEINNGSTFYVNSSTTDTLKINSTGGIPHQIRSHGNLIVDSVKIVGWDSSKNNYATIDKNGTFPRSYIFIDKDADNTNITNSEIAYLGYDKSDGFGLTSYSRSGISLSNNIIHNLYYGLRSVNILDKNSIENNEIYNNSKDGIYLQGHGMSIKYNNVRDNGNHGIFCSTNCYNVVFDSNEIHGNSKEGIMLYKNVSNSIIRNNNLSDNKEQVAIYESSKNNTVFNNKMSGGKVGIRISNSSQNAIIDNYLMDSIYGIYVLDGGSTNKINSNQITNTSGTGLLVQGSNTNNNIFKNNILWDNAKNEISKIGNNSNLFFNNTIGISPKNRNP